MTDRNYRPDIDGLRAIAVVAVVLFHAFPARLPGGFIGVDIFFVISGYLISRIIFDELATDKFSFIGFYTRRARRLFPALIVVLLACALAGWVTLLADEYAQLGKHIAASVGFVQNLVLLRESGYFDNTAELKPLLHLWSLGIEEQFYIVWPVVLYLLWKRGVNVKWIIAIGALTSFFLCVWLTQIRPTTAFFLPVTRFWELLFGAGLAWMSRRSVHVSRFASSRLTDWLSLGGLLLIVAGLLLITKRSDFPGAWALLPVTGAALLIAAGPDALINRTILSNRIIVWVGLISYPLYLWHWPLLTFAHILENQFPVAAIRLGLVFASFVLAWLTYALVERPVRYTSRMQKTTTSLLWIMMLILGGAGLTIYASSGWVTRPVVKASASNTKIVLIDPLPAQPCQAVPQLSVNLTHDIAGFCKAYVPEVPTKLIVMWGDSSVISWSPIFATIAKERQIQLIVLSHPSCPPILGARKTFFTYEDSKRYCSEGKIQNKVLQYIELLKPDSIVLAASWSAYLHREYIGAPGVTQANQTTAKALFDVALPETVIRLSKLSPVTLIMDWPLMPSRPSLRSVTLFNYKKDPISIDAEEFKAYSAYATERLTQQQSGRVTLFNPATKVCDDLKCMSARDGLLYYEDSYHMTPQGSMQFRKEIEEILGVVNNR